MQSERGDITLGMLVTLQRGTTYKSAMLGLPGPVLLGLASIQRDGGFRNDSLKTYGGESSDKLLMRPGDIYVSLKDVTQSGDLLGSVARVPDNVPLGRLTQDTVKLQLQETSYPPDLLYWALRTPKYRAYCREHAIGTTNLSLSRDDFLAFKLPLPTDGQMNLVSLLNDLELRIKQLRETNATLEAIAQTIFKSWFVDFDPVRAKASLPSPSGRGDGGEGETAAATSLPHPNPLPEGEGVPGMDAETAALFPDSFEDSELGEIPKGWRAVPFGNLLNTTIGGDWGKDVPDAEHTIEVAIIRGTDIPDIKAGSIGTVPCRYVTPKKLKSRLLQDGDIIIEVSGGSKTQATGRSLYCTATLIHGFGKPVEPASFCRLLRPVSRETGLLLAVHLSSIYAAGKMWNYQVQSTGLANFQTTHFLESELVVVPPEPVLKAFFDMARPLIERQQTEDIRTTAALRDTLLPRLMSGKILVSDNVS